MLIWKIGALLLEEGLKVWAKSKLVHYWHAVYVTSSIISDTAVATEAYRNKNTHSEKHTDDRLNFNKLIKFSISQKRYQCAHSLFLLFWHIHIYEMCLQTNTSAPKAWICHEYGWCITHKTPTLKALAHTSLPFKHKSSLTHNTFLHQASHHQTASLWKGPEPSANLRGSDDTKHMCEPPTASDWQACWTQLVVTDQNISLAGTWWEKVTDRRRESSLNGHHND